MNTCDIWPPLREPVDHWLPSIVLPFELNWFAFPEAPKLDAFFAERPDLFAWRRPDGGCVGYPRYLGPGGVEAFATTLLEEAGVLVLPSSIFPSELGPTPRDRFRIGFGRAGLDDGLAAFRAHLRS